MVIHDVTPVFAAEIDRFLDALQPLIGNCFAGGVVPRWHGNLPGKSSRHCFARWSNCFGDFILHGWTHLRETGRGVVSWCTDRADEFARCSLGETLERLQLAMIAAEDLLGRSLRGFLPPAWRLSASISDVQPLGIDYLMRFRSLEPHGQESIPLAVWSWDWGWLPGTHHAGTALGAVGQWMNRRAVPIVALHPLDIRRGRSSAALQLIHRFLAAGLSPVLPRDLISEAAGLSA